MKQFTIFSIFMLNILTIPAIEACKVTIKNNTGNIYQLREEPDGKPKMLNPKRTVSFGSPTHRATFIVVEKTNGGWKDIRKVKQTTCGGDKSEKKLSMQGILAHKLGKHQDKFEITKL